MAATLTSIRFRGTWAPGVHYAVDDQVARGRFSYVALVDHVAGGRSEPGHGELWPKLWEPSDGVVTRTSDAPAAASPLALPAPYHPPALVPPQHLPAVHQPAPLPERIPVASEILDDSYDDGGETMNVAFTLSYLRAQIGHTARKDWVEREFRQLNEVVQQIIKQIGAGLAPALAETTVNSEAWKRKAALLQAPDRAEAETICVAILRERLKLLTKRDKGLTWTAQEATRSAILDELDRQIDRIDDAATALDEVTPDDIADDRHWPRIGDDV